MTRVLAFLWAVFLATAPLAAETPIRVFAAASLRGVLEDIAAQDSQGMQLSFGGSGTMARQVANGAPADVVILANSLWTEWLLTQRVARPEDTTDIAQNRLVLIAPAGNPPLTAANDLPERLGKDRLAMGQRAAVPAGIYARQWLEDAGLWDAVADQLAETDNVRAALALVARQQTPFGVVYATDAAAEPAVTVVFAIPDTAHDPIRYTAVPLTPAGATFTANLTRPAAQAIFARHGFAPVTP